MKKLYCLPQFKVSLAQKRLVWDGEKPANQESDVNFKGENLSETLKGSVDLANTELRREFYRKVREDAELSKTSKNGNTTTVDKMADVLLQELEKAEAAEKQEGQNREVLANKVADGYIRLMLFVNPDAPEKIRSMWQELGSKVEARMGAVSEQKASNPAKKEEERKEEPKPKVEPKKKPAEKPKVAADPTLVAGTKGKDSGRMDDVGAQLAASQRSMDQSLAVSGYADSTEAVLREAAVDASRFGDTSAEATKGKPAVTSPAQQGGQTTAAVRTEARAEKTDVAPTASPEKVDRKNVISEARKTLSAGNNSFKAGSVSFRVTIDPYGKANEKGEIPYIITNEGEKQVFSNPITIFDKPYAPNANSPKVNTAAIAPEKVASVPPKASQKGDALSRQLAGLGLDLEGRKNATAGVRSNSVAAPKGGASGDKPAGLTLGGTGTVVPGARKGPEQVVDTKADVRGALSQRPKDGPSITFTNSESVESPGQKLILGKAREALDKNQTKFMHNGVSWTIDNRGNSKYHLKLDKNQKPFPPAYASVLAQENLKFNKDFDVKTFEDKYGLAWNASQRYGAFTLTLGEKSKTYIEFEYTPKSSGDVA